MHSRKFLGVFPERVIGNVNHCVSHLRIRVKSKLGFEEEARYRQVCIGKGGPGGQDSMRPGQGQPGLGLAWLNYQVTKVLHKQRPPGQVTAPT